MQEAEMRIPPSSLRPDLNPGPPGPPLPFPAQPALKSDWRNHCFWHTDHCLSLPTFSSAIPPYGMSSFCLLLTGKAFSSTCKARLHVPFALKTVHYHHSYPSMNQQEPSIIPEYSSCSVLCIIYKTDNCSVLHVYILNIHHVLSCLLCCFSKISNK